MERWIEFAVAPLEAALAPRRAQRFEVRAARRAPPGPEVTSVARCEIVPWQSTQSSSIAARGSP